MHHSLALALIMAVVPVKKEKVLDEGTLSITVAGRRAGHESFSIVEVSGGYEIRTTTQLIASGPASTVKGTLRTDSRWRPIEGQFDWRAGGVQKRLTLARKGDLPELAIQGPGRMVMVTRPGRGSDLFVSTSPTVLAHLIPLCRLAGPKEQTLTVFPAAPLRVSPVTTQPFPQTNVGAPAVPLQTMVVDLAQSARFELVCDGPKLVALRQNGRGLTAVRASYEAVAAALEARVRSKPPLPETLVDLPRRIGGLACALLVPKTHAAKTPASVTVGGMRYTPETKPLAAVLLLSDSEIQDRDGDPAGHGDPELSILKVAAIRLGEAGIASLRCDDRGLGRVTAAPPAMETLAADARALLAALRREPAIDPARVGLVGHGEGGLIAALAAAKDPKVGALALLGTQGRPLDVLVLDQSEQSMRRFGYPEDEIRAVLDQQRAVYEAVRARKALPASLSRTERQAVSRALPWIRSHVSHDPAADIARASGIPVLVAQGGRDVQVTMKDAELLRDALTRAGNARLTVKIYPELNHPFATSPSGSLADYMDPRAEISEVFLQDLVRFAKGALVGAR